MTGDLHTDPRLGLVRELDYDATLAAIDRGPCSAETIYVHDHDCVGLRRDGYPCQPDVIFVERVLAVGSAPENT